MRYCLTGFLLGRNFTFTKFLRWYRHDNIMVSVDMKRVKKIDKIFIIGLLYFGPIELPLGMTVALLIYYSGKSL